MLQIFRTFQAAGIFVILTFAAILRAPFTVLGLVDVPYAHLNPWGTWVQNTMPKTELICWIAGLIVLVLLAFTASILLQQYRLADAGMVPAFVLVMLSSSLVLWLGFSPLLLGTGFTAVACFRLYECYRYQGASLPVFDTGLALGAAALIAPAFIWLFPAGIFGLVQLRGFRTRDFFGMLVGFVTPAFLVAVFFFLRNDLASIFNPEAPFTGLAYFSGLGQFPALSTIESHWPWLTILLVLSLWSVSVFQSLTGRRPIQEQRFSRLMYTFLGFGWLAIVLSGPLHSWALAFVLFPLSILLGIWLSELSKKVADLISLITLFLILSGYLWSYIV